MTLRMLRRPLVAALFLGISLVSVLCVQASLGGLDFARAQDLESAIEDLANSNEAAAESQAQVNAVDDELTELEQRYLAAEARATALKSYVEQLRSTLRAQGQQRASLEAQIDRVVEVSRELMPLMRRMLDALGEFVALDTPFLLNERTERIDRLNEAMSASDVSVAERFRVLLEAYEIELEYGRTLETYKAELPHDPRQENRVVRFLRLGRVTLVYETLDGSERGVWDGSARKWMPLGAEFGPDISRAVRVAREQAPPELLFLPVLSQEEDKADR